MGDFRPRKGTGTMDEIRLDDINTLADALGLSVVDFKRDCEINGVHIEWDEKTVSIWATAFAITSGTDELFSREFTFPVELDAVTEWLQSLNELIAYA